MNSKKRTQLRRKKQHSEHSVLHDFLIFVLQLEALHKLEGADAD